MRPLAALRTPAKLADSSHSCPVVNAALETFGPPLSAYVHTVDWVSLKATFWQPPDVSTSLQVPGMLSYLYIIAYTEEAALWLMANCPEDYELVQEDAP